LACCPWLGGLEVDTLIRCVHVRIGAKPEAIGQRGHAPGGHHGTRASREPLEASAIRHALLPSHFIAAVRIDELDRTRAEANRLHIQIRCRSQKRTTHNFRCTTSHSILLWLLAP
jgi:hypothetical protein